MRFLKLSALLLCSAIALFSQTHVHPHTPGAHGHDQHRRRNLHFGTINVPEGISGTVRIAPSAGATPTVSPLLKVASTTGSGPATYYITDTAVEGDETYWSVRAPAASALSFDLVKTTDSTKTVQVTLDALPSASEGTYIRDSSGFWSPYFYWGGTVSIPANTPDGTYTATTPTWTTIGPNSGQPVNGFVITEDWCSQRVTYGISDEETTFTVTIVIQRTRSALEVRATSNLHFGAVVPVGTAGTVRLAPATPASRTPTTVKLANQGTPPSPGIFTVLGNAGSTVDFIMPTGTTLTGPGGATMSVTDFTYALRNSAGNPITPSAGGNGGTGSFVVGSGGTTARTVTFLVGATLQVGASQAPGSYTGTYSVGFAYR